MYLHIGRAVVVVGFEPTEDILTFTRFRGVYLWPLRHTTKSEINYLVEVLKLSLFFKYGLKASGIRTLPSFC